MKELLISLDSRSGKPLYEQIYTFIKEEIRNGKIPPGERLPSSRALARQLSAGARQTWLTNSSPQRGISRACPAKGILQATSQSCISWAGCPGGRSRFSGRNAPATDMILQSAELTGGDSR